MLKRLSINTTILIESIKLKTTFKYLQIQINNIQQIKRISIKRSIVTII